MKQLRAFGPRDIRLIETDAPGVIGQIVEGSGGSLKSIVLVGSPLEPIVQEALKP